MNEQVDSNLQTDNDIELQSIITCPNCKHEQSELMSVDSCLVFYSCTNCDEGLRPATEDCCIFCTFGSVICPSKQKQTISYVLSRRRRLRNERRKNMGNYNRSVEKSSS